MSRGYGRGKSPKKFNYTYESLSEVLNMTPAAVRKHAQRGNFNPADLLSVLEFINLRLQRNKLQENKTDSLEFINKLNQIKSKD